jgi:hypothetical protein
MREEGHLLVCCVDIHLVLPRLPSTPGAKPHVAVGVARPDRVALERQDLIPVASWSCGCRIRLGPQRSSPYRVLRCPAWQPLPGAPQTPACRSLRRALRDSGERGSPRRCGVLGHSWSRWRRRRSDWHRAPAPETSLRAARETRLSRRARASCATNRRAPARGPALRKRRTRPTARSAPRRNETRRRGDARSTAAPATSPRPPRREDPAARL